MKIKQKLKCQHRSVNNWGDAAAGADEVNAAAGACARRLPRSTLSADLRKFQQNGKSSKYSIQLQTQQYQKIQNIKI